MRFAIEHEVPGRVRVKLDGRIPARDVDPLITVILANDDVTDVRVYPRIGSVAVTYGAGPGARDRVMGYLATVDQAALDDARSDYNFQLASREHDLLLKIADHVANHYLQRWFLPRPIRRIFMLRHYLKFLREANESLVAGRLDVPVLDATAIGSAFAQGDLSAASGTMFLLDLEEIIEDYTRAASQNELIYSLLSVPDTALRVEGGQEQSVSAADLAEGDLAVFRTGMPVSVDGVVERGCAMVNQAALTGEPLAVERTVGDDVFAGTAIESGEVYVRVRRPAGKTKLRSIVSLVEQSSDLKGETQERRDRLADSIVPWNLLLAAIVGIATRSLVKTAAALMVDYSCALKLTGSISVLSAMSESARRGFTVKGSKYFERVAQADTIVFDKTGTLTDATPRVSKVLGFDGWRPDRVLRLAACLEEHFPHPVARAVVDEAASRSLKHRERHAEVEYIVAHGIASSLDGKRVVIGSSHFVTEDEGVAISDEQRARIYRELGGAGILYLAVDGVLVGALGIDDPLKPEAASAIAELKRLGFKRIVMLTGDSSKAAERAATAAGITEYHWGIMPEQKHEYVRRLRDEGHRVLMVGDGVNDSPALACADVGVAMAQGTAIAREVADITLSTGNLFALVELRRLSQGLMGRFNSTFRRIMVFNSLLLALGIGGVITPQTSSLLHNASTTMLGMASAKAYLPPA